MTVTTALLLWYLVYAGRSSATYHHNRRPRQANSALDAHVKLRRAFHSSAVLNGWLYVDGGEFSSSTGGEVVYQYADTMVSIDLRKDWTNTSVALHSSMKPPEAPSLNNGGIWVDQANNVLYTGFAGTESSFGANIKYPQGLWSFTPDGSGGGSWKNLNKTADASFVDVPRPYKGQVASGNGLGFFLGGFIGNESGQQSALSSLITYNLTSNELTNLTIAGVSNRGLEQMGGMVYVPNFGNQGILVNMGGDQDGRVEADDLIPFRRVQVYDPENQRWFEQKTTGDLPQPRKEFCIAGAPSSGHTYEILVYAGYDGELGTAAIPYDSAFVLTIPGFYWVKANYTAANPRHGLSCNLVGNSQVLIIGGVDTLQRNSSDTEDQYHDAFDTPDPFTGGLAIFDLSRLRWSSSYTAVQEPYVAAPQIRDFYETRGNKPESGFVSPALEALFSVQNFDDNVQFPSSAAAIARKSNAGAIAGGVIGGVGGLLLVIGMAVCFRRRRNRVDKLRVRAMAAVRDPPLPRATRPGPVTQTEAFHDKNTAPEKKEMTSPATLESAAPSYASRPELPVASSEVFQGKTPGGEAPNDVQFTRQDIHARDFAAELPGNRAPAELSEHDRHASELDQQVDELPDSRTWKERKMMNEFKFPG